MDQLDPRQHPASRGYRSDVPWSTLYCFYVESTSCAAWGLAAAARCGLAGSIKFDFAMLTAGYANRISCGLKKIMVDRRRLPIHPSKSSDPVVKALPVVNFAGTLVGLN